ncbi:hypothetical protein HAX54_009446 [Datura stramonium]|uniref:Uncharacterized protein n=1 Tax=Datura stramonium TaxID=4076 RepID=A0ABS8THJ6_DATST|nr:hypothetical protein [Datura stramonium]
MQSSISLYMIKPLNTKGSFLNREGRRGGERSGERREGLAAVVADFAEEDEVVEMPSRREEEPRGRWVFLSGAGEVRRWLTVERSEESNGLLYGYWCSGNGDSGEE